MKNQFKNILLGIIASTVLIAVLFYFFLFLNPLNFHDSNTLKWIPILIAGISIYSSARLNQNTSWKLLPLILLPLILFKAFNFLYFPFVFFLLLVGAAMILVNRNNILTKYRIMGWMASIAIFLYFLFSQPLIIEKEGFGYNDQGQLINAITLWDFTEKTDVHLPDHNVADRNGENFNLNKLEGKTYFITFWATWCAPCLEEQHELEKLKESYKHHPEVEFIDISYDNDREKWLQTIKKSQPMGMQLISKNQQETSRAFKFQGIPMHLIVNPNGTYKKYEPFQTAKSILESSVQANYPSGSSHLEQLNQFFDKVESKGHMGSISFFHNGKEVYNRAMGFADLESQTRASKQTKYRIGSISKTFTATLVMQLVEEGKLHFDDNLAEYFPNISNASNITIEHLLKHRSGLFDLTKQEDFERWMEKSQTKQQMINRIVENDTIFKENERKEYSNTNYILLSYIIEQVEGNSYAEILNERIIKTANLQNTYYGSKINTQNHEALSYIMDGEWKLATETDLSIPLGAGGIVSSPTDLNIFYTKLFKGELISGSSLEAMTTFKDGGGIGLSQLPFPTKKAFGHPGSIDGFNSIVVHFPKEKVTVSYISNGEVIQLRNLFFQALNIYFGGETGDFAKKETT
ncbi:MAG: serine hydrolase [Bacteroidota bacterium]